MAPEDSAERRGWRQRDHAICQRRRARRATTQLRLVARVVVRIDAAGPPTRASVEVTPALLVSSAADAGRVLIRVEADAIDAAPPPAPAGLIDQIQPGAQTTTIAFALNARAGTPRVTTATTSESTRVTIEVPLAAQSQDTSAAPPGVPAPPVGSTSPAPPTPSTSVGAAPAPGPPASPSGPGAVTVDSPDVPVVEDVTIRPPANWSGA